MYVTLGYREFYPPNGQRVLYAIYLAFEEKNIYIYISGIRFKNYAFLSCAVVCTYVYPLQYFSRYVTLGYGEFYPVVFAAKGFVCLYMMVFLGMVSSALPEVITHHDHDHQDHDHDFHCLQVVDIMLAKPKFAIPYLPEDRPFIVVSYDK